jgi:hypothetical protein
MTEDVTPIPAAVSPTWWAELPAAEKAELWEKVVPGTGARIIDLTDKRVVHMQRLAWAKVGLAGLGILCGFGTVVLFVWLARFYAEQHAAVEGATIIGSLAAVVAVFVGGRIVRDVRSSDNPAKPVSNQQAEDSRRS